MIDRCSFAYPGTFGHECGAAAVSVAVFVSKPTEATIPRYVTASGLFYAGRCEACAMVQGGENAGVLRFGGTGRGEACKRVGTVQGRESWFVV